MIEHVLSDYNLIVPEPTGCLIVAPLSSGHPQTENDRGEHAGGADAPVQLALHDLESVPAGLIFAHGVIHEQARQIKQCGEPAHHGDNMKGFNPEQDRKSTRLNSSHVAISYAVF